MNRKCDNIKHDCNKIHNRDACYFFSNQNVRTIFTMSEKYAHRIGIMIMCIHHAIDRM